MTDNKAEFKDEPEGPVYASIPKGKDVSTCFIRCTNGLILDSGLLIIAQEGRKVCSILREGEGAHTPSPSFSPFLPRPEIKLVLFSFISVSKDLRCCRTCKLLKTLEQFEEEGCENCEWDGNDTPEMTTVDYSGMIAMMDPSKTWAGKWTHISRRLPGVYAIEITEEVVENDEYDDYDEDLM